MIGKQKQQQKIPEWQQGLLLKKALIDLDRLQMKVATVLDNTPCAFEKCKQQQADKAFVSVHGLDLFLRSKPLCSKHTFLFKLEL